MKIAITTKGIDMESPVDSRFGRTEYILLFNDETDELTHFDNRAIANAEHGAGPQTAQKLFELNPDILITGNGPGGNASAVLSKSKIKTFVGAGNMTAKQAYDAFKNNALTEMKF